MNYTIMYGSIGDEDVREFTTLKEAMAFVKQRLKEGDERVDLIKGYGTNNCTCKIFRK